MLAAGVVKKEEELGSEAMLVENVHQYVLGDNNRNFDSNNNYKGISIAERRAATCVFNASNINSTDWFTATGVPTASQPIKSPYFTIPPGISPSALLDSPVMLHNDQVQLSPTTGTFQFTSTKPLVHPFSKDLIGENEVLAKNNCFVDSFAISETFGNKSWPEAESLVSQTNHFLTGDNRKERTKTQNREKQQKGMALTKDVAKYSDDGYYWRKYGQKQVKGSEYPRSYFKCTNTDCQVKKKVERSYEGEITEIVYKGSHNHPQPQTDKQFGDTTEINEGTRVKDEDQSVNEFGTFSTSFVSDFSSPLSQALEPVGTQERSPTFGSQGGDDKDDASRDSISVNADDGRYGECEPKRRKRNNETSSISRSNREPRVVVQIESEIDILDDGYRWRKYGQKVVKGNPNPRSYYKCTTPGCPVRKHVERAANDIKSVITTYEGKHNHEVPSSKNSTFLISDVASLPSNVANNTTTSTALKTIHLPKTGKETQTLPLYLQQKPMLSCSYNEFMMSNFPGHDLNFGASSNYPLSYPTFPYSSSLFLNGNDMKTFPTSDLYPMLPPMPSQMNPVSLSTNLPPLMNTYPGIQPSIRGNELYNECQLKILKQKQEQRDDVGVFDASCLYIPNQGHGTV